MQRIWLLLFVSLLSACNLTQTSPDAAGVTLQPLSTQSLMAANCDPTQSGAVWVLYTAAVGETVDDIIKRMGTTSEIVMNGNCWTSIPTVGAGSQWYMPPASVEALADLTNIPVGGTLNVTPSDYGIGGTLSLLDPQVTLALVDFPANASSVFFYLRRDGDVIGIGTDSDLSDGATMAWETLPNLTYDRAALAAVAYDSVGTPIRHTQEFGVNTM